VGNSGRGGGGKQRGRESRHLTAAGGEDVGEEQALAWRLDEALADDLYVCARVFVHACARPRGLYR
jgi:hypothetical protein